MYIITEARMHNQGKQIVQNVGQKATQNWKHSHYMLNTIRKNRFKNSTNIERNPHHMINAMKKIVQKFNQH